LSRNYLGDDEALALAAVLGKIERLSLGRSRLTHKSFSAFAEACEARATAVSLSLECNVAELLHQRLLLLLLWYWMPEVILVFWYLFSKSWSKYWVNLML